MNSVLEVINSRPAIVTYVILGLLVFGAAFRWVWRIDEAEMEKAHAANEAAWTERSLEGARARLLRKQKRTAHAQAWLVRRRNALAEQAARPVCLTCGRRNPAHPRSRIVHPARRAW